MTTEPACDAVSAGMESTSLVNMVCRGRSAEYQTDSLVYSIETVTLPQHSHTESCSKCVNHNHLILQPKHTTTKRFLVPVPKLSTMSSTDWPVTGNCSNELKTVSPKPY